MTAFERYQTEHKLSGNEMADLLGVHWATYSNWKTGARKVRPQDVLEICRTLNNEVAPHELRPDVFEAPPASGGQAA